MERGIGVVGGESAPSCWEKSVALGAVVFSVEGGRLEVTSVSGPAAELTLTRSTLRHQKRRRGGEEERWRGKMELGGREGGGSNVELRPKSLSRSPAVELLQTTIPIQKVFAGSSLPVLSSILSRLGRNSWHREKKEGEREEGRAFLPLP